MKAYLYRTGGSCRTCRICTRGILLLSALSAFHYSLYASRAEADGGWRYCSTHSRAHLTASLWGRKHTGSVKRHDVVPDFDIVYAGTNRLDDAAALVAQDHGEGTFGVVAG